MALNPRGPLGTGPIGPVSNQSLDGWMDVLFWASKSQLKRYFTREDECVFNIGHL